MDLFVERDELGRGLARIQGIIERRGMQPLLSHVLIAASEGQLRMTATDTEIAFIGDLEANVREPGDIAVDAANLFQIVRALPEATVQLSLTENSRLLIKCGRSEFKLPGYPAEEFPALPSFDSKGSAKISEGVLRRMVEQTAFAVAVEDVRYGLNGAHLEEVEENGQRHLRVVTTDGHRLSASQGAVAGDVMLMPKMLVPRKALGVLRKLLDNDDNEVDVSFGDGAIRLDRPSQRVWFRLLDGEFPDYKGVLPSEHKHRVLVRRGDLAATLKRVGILVQDKGRTGRAVRFAFGPTDLEIDVHDVDRGEVRESVPIELDGEPIEIGFNARYLGEVLQAMSGDRVSLEFAHALAPCLVRDPDDPAAFFVVMPMRLD
ncbi:MAG: DNA polymerase III subunit beta [Myxococcota bacterium]